jgi:hypothetical protein
VQESKKEVKMTVDWMVFVSHLAAMALSLVLVLPALGVVAHLFSDLLHAPR